MPHIITGEIRKAPFVKQGDRGTLYIVELSESFKSGRDAPREYTNYKFFFNDNNNQAISGWYAEAFQEGKVISVSCETLKVDVRDHEGKQYITLMPGDFPKLIFSQRGDGQPQGGNGQQQRQQTQQHRQQPQQHQNWDSDIPF